MHVIFQDGQVYCGNQLDWRGCTAVRMTASMNWAGRMPGGAAPAATPVLDCLDQLRCTRKLIVPFTPEGATSILQSPVGPESVVTVPVSFRFRW
jgi:hypothetical protein